MKHGPWRLIFMGTPQFALPSLEGLLSSGEEVLAVVTQPQFIKKQVRLAIYKYINGCFNLQ